MTWPLKPLGEMAETALGKMLDNGRLNGFTRVPYLRNVNVQWGRIDTEDLRTMELADGDRIRFGVSAGDLLVCEGGDVGRCAIWRGSDIYMAYQKALHRIRPGPQLKAAFLRYLLEHHSYTGALTRLSTGSTIAHLPQQQLRRVLVPAATMTEQHRVVEILEDHLSRLDAADKYVSETRARLSRLREQLVIGAVTGSGVNTQRMSSPLPAVGTSDGDLAQLPVDWKWQRLGDITDVVGGVTKDAKKQGDPSFVDVPYLRVANVQRGALRLNDVTSIRVSPAKAESLRLRPGDVLLNEGGDRDKLARGWVWNGEIAGCIHQNHVFRARPHEGVDPYFLSWCANTIGGQWAERNGRQSVNLASISLSVIRKMPIIVPPPGTAAQIVRDLHDQLHELDRTSDAIVAASQSSAALRRAVLAAAFSGKLTGRSTDAEVIEELAQ